MRAGADAWGLVRAVRWVLVTGRDRDLAPSLGRWRGPVWVWRALVAVAAVGWGLSHLWVWHRGTGFVVADGLLLVLQVLPALLSWRRPLTATRIVFLATAVAMAVFALLLPVHTGPLPRWPLDTYLAPFAPIVAAAIARSRGLHGAGIAVVTLALLGSGAQLYGSTVLGADVMTGPLAVAVVVVVFGFALNHQRRSAEVSAEAVAVERERRVVLQERARIARELHDVVGHHLSMIAVRTDSAPYRLPGLDEATRTELAELGEAARQALDEARRLLAVLREDGSEPEHAPQPAIGDVPDLVRESVAAGERVRLAVEGTVDTAPAAVQLAAYRIVQEALSNARRHSPGAPVRVRVSSMDGEIRVLVENGPGQATPVARGGSGLVGIRERVAMLGGRCEAGAGRDGGFVVSASLPVTGMRETTA